MGQDLWESAPATIEGDAWKPDDTGFAADDGFKPDGGAADGDGFDGDFGRDNVSKHVGGAGDGGCRNCGEDGHFARDCPNERVEREFTGECNECGEIGHRRADCPSRPAQVCKLCGMEGHIKSECTINRLTHGLADLSVEDAWKALEQSDYEREVDEIKAAILAYARAYPDVTFEELEPVFRDAKMNTFLIAKEQNISKTHTIVNLQGKTGMKYAVNIQFTDKPRRARFSEGWPKTPEENMVRLTEAGFIMDSLQPKCRNCDQMGHISAKCPEEKREAEKVEIKCGNCNEVGHRYRDCPEPRKSNKKGCRRCGGDHMVKDCEQEPDPSEMTCRKCNETGHMAKDCPDQECYNCGQKGHGKDTCENERVFKCRNCEKYGHAAKECPEPKDWSKVQCNNCKEFGHTIKRCPNPAAEAEEGGDGDGGW